ncbi:MAG: response regulator transcription factor [Chlorobaculum sp.]|jgi:DNA-binding response OmpR family regulator|nr:response regulator transcription factor [Chlorobaculum sp.]
MPLSDTSFNQIIFVEDDAVFRSTIEKYLQKKGYEVTVAGTAIEFYREFEKEKFALAIIDIRLPDQNGLVLAKYVRANSSARIILMTGDASPDVSIEGYDAGADIFLTKPINFRLLDAALGSLLMRVSEQSTVQTDTVPVKPVNNAYSHFWLLRTEAWELITPCGEKIHLTGREYPFLQALAESPNAQVARTTLLQKLGYPLDEYGNRSLESLIYRLRKKISSNLETPIKTVNGTGYTFTAKIEIEN